MNILVMTYIKGVRKYKTEGHWKYRNPFRSTWFQSFMLGSMFTTFLLRCFWQLCRNHAIFFYNESYNFILKSGVAAERLLRLTVLLIKEKEKDLFWWALQPAVARMLPRGVRQHTVILRRNINVLYTMVNKNQAQHLAAIFWQQMISRTSQLKIPFQHQRKIFVLLMKTGWAWNMQIA